MPVSCAAAPACAAADPVGFDDTFWEAVTVDQAAANDPAGMTVAVEHAAPTAGVASVVFVDDVAPGHSGHDSNDRSSALRRLIGSLLSEIGPIAAPATMPTDLPPHRRTIPPDPPSNHGITLTETDPDLNLDSLREAQLIDTTLTRT